MIDVTTFEDALRQLEKSLAYLGSDASRDDPELRKQFRAASIQAFEFTYELAVKMIRRQLAEIVANPGELQSMAFMDLVRTGAEAGLVRDAPSFRIFREARNVTTHAYDESKAEQVVASLDDFVAEMRFLLAALTRRNRGRD